MSKPNHKPKKQAARPVSQRRSAKRSSSPASSKATGPTGTVDAGDGYLLELLPPAMPDHPDLHNPVDREPVPRREVLDEERPPEGTPEYERWQREWAAAMMWGMAKYGFGDEDDDHADDDWNTPPDDGTFFWGARYRYLFKPFRNPGPSEGSGDPDYSGG